MKQSLNGVWHLADFCDLYGNEYAERASRSAVWALDTAIPASVPGLVSDDLLSARRITDPNWGNNVEQSRWVIQRDWVYWRTFEVGELSGKPVRLHIDSLDVFASIYINGILVGRHENQFVRFRSEISRHLKKGVNRIAVALEAVWPGTVRRAKEKLPFWGKPWERLYVRRSQMAYGWDWSAGPSITGIPGSVYLEYSENVLLGDWHIKTAALEETAVSGGATLESVLELDCAEAGELEIVYELDGREVSRTAEKIAAGIHTTSSTVDCDRMEYWYPGNYGEPKLYRLDMKIFHNHVLMEERSKNIGFRTVQLVLRNPQDPSEKTFYLTVNGKKIWLRGENYLPLDFIHTRSTKEMWIDYLGKLKLGGVNCIRVWGGGIIEKTEFYEACSELGLLVWHDFMFACGIYPNTPEFLGEIRREAADMVKRLRSECCIAIWCGNNENEVLAVSTPNSKEWYRKHPIYYEVLPEVLRTLDPERPYWPGSPASESMSVHPDSPGEGDRHNWDMWHGWKRIDCIGDDARMNTEFGAQSFPQRETLESFMRPDELQTTGQLNLPEGPSPGLIFARHGAQMERLFSRCYDYGDPAHINNIIACTQMFQADVMARYIGHYRMMKHTGGVIVWNYTAVWPSICWALVDYYRRPKQAFYAAKRAFSDLTAVVEPADSDHRVFRAAANCESGKPFDLKLRLLRVADGRVEWEAKSSGEAIEYKVPPDLDRSACALVAYASNGSDCARSIRYLNHLRFMKAEPAGEGVAAATGHLYTAKDPVRYLHQPSARPLTVTQSGARRLTFSSPSWRCRVGVESMASLIWSDNYFDLLPDETREIELISGEMPEKLFLVADSGSRKVWLLGEDNSITV